MQSFVVNGESHIAAVDAAVLCFYLERNLMFSNEAICFFGFVRVSGVWVILRNVEKQLARGFHEKEDSSTSA